MVLHLSSWKGFFLFNVFRFQPSVHLAIAMCAMCFMGKFRESIQMY